MKNEEAEKEILFSLSKEHGILSFRQPRGAGPEARTGINGRRLAGYSIRRPGAVGFCQEERYFEVNRVIVEAILYWGDYLRKKNVKTG
jgi:hypothetical protein